MPRRACARFGRARRRRRDGAAHSRHLRARPRRRRSARAPRARHAGARRRPTTSTPTTSMPTTWRAPASPRCIAAGRSASSTSATTASCSMGDYFDLAADLHGLARPPRLARAEAAAALSPLQMSFLGESRRLVNRRLKEELGVVLRHATVTEGLRASRRLSADGRAEQWADDRQEMPHVFPAAPARPDPRDLRRCLGGDVLRPSSATPPSPSRRTRPPAPGRPSRSAWSRRSTPAARSTSSTASSPRSSPQRLGQQVFVDAVPGANTINGADVVAKAAARRLHLHDHDDVDAREQHGAVQQAAVRSGQGLRADHPGLARQRPADRAGHRAVRRPEGLRRLGEGSRTGRSPTARGASARRPTSTARSWPGTTA